MYNSFNKNLERLDGGLYEDVRLSTSSQIIKRFNAEESKMFNLLHFIYMFIEEKYNV